MALISDISIIYASLNKYFNRLYGDHVWKVQICDYEIWPLALSLFLELNF